MASVTPLDRVMELVRARGAVAQLCVLHDGKVVLDRTFGCEPDSLFLTFSVSKPFVALLVHLLADRGVFRLDDPVAAYWPAFERYGKDTITIRHVLSHRAGIPVAGRSLLGDVWAMTDWEQAVRRAEHARPRWPAGEVPAYHILSYGFILGELIRRATGTPVRELLSTELIRPMGLTDVHLGLPDGVWSRHVPLVAGYRGGVGRRVVFNRRRTRQAVIPAATVSATARDTARFYQSLLDGALPPAVLAEATRMSCDGEPDRFLNRPVRWAHGFQLGGPVGTVRSSGRDAGPETFGHNGSSTCNAWADPTRRLVFAYMTNLVMPRLAGLRHQCEISDAVRAVLPQE